MIDIYKIVDDIMDAFNSLSPQGIFAMVVICAAATTFICLVVQGSLLQ